jgi:hypothetical protein
MKRLESLLREYKTPICEGLSAKLPDAEGVACYLLAHSVMAPPAEIGQTLYAPIPAYTRIDTPMLEELKAFGIGFYNDKWFIFDNHGDLLEIGADVYIDREEAQKVLDDKQKEIDAERSGRDGTY